MCTILTYHGAFCLLKFMQFFPSRTLLYDSAVTAHLYFHFLYVSDFINCLLNLLQKKRAEAINLNSWSTFKWECFKTIINKQLYQKCCSLWQLDCKPILLIQNFFVAWCILVLYTSCPISFGGSLMASFKSKINAYWMKLINWSYLNQANSLLELGMGLREKQIDVIEKSIIHYPFLSFNSNWYFEEI